MSFFGDSSFQCKCSLYSAKSHHYSAGISIDFRNTAQRLSANILGSYLWAFFSTYNTEHLCSCIIRCTVLVAGRWTTGIWLLSHLINSSRWVCDDLIKLNLLGKASAAYRLNVIHSVFFST